MKRAGKRLFDLTAAGMLLAFFFPVMLAVMMGIVVFFGSPVFFRQERPGRDGRPFRLVKFRTMRNAIGPKDSSLPDEARLTSFGKFLRSTSLDELPELWNVVTGDMSLVGPRPLLMEYLPLYTPEQARRHEVRPGITGWAQVNGRNALSWEKRFELDVWYVDNQSWRLDMLILWKTVCQTLRRVGISHQGHATMPKFTGTAKNDQAAGGWPKP